MQNDNITGTTFRVFKAEDNISALRALKQSIIIRTDGVDANSYRC